MSLISLLEKYLGKKAEINMLDMQPGDVKATYADIGHSRRLLNYQPKTTIKDGLPKFVDWYKDYHNYK